MIMNSHNRFLTDDEVDLVWHENRSLKGIDLESTESAYGEVVKVDYRTYVNSGGSDLTNKKWLCVVARVTKDPVMQNIFAAEIGTQDIVLVNPITGELGAYNKHLYELDYGDKTIVLKRGSEGERVIYDGSHLVTTTGNWLRAPLNGLSKQGSTGFSVACNRTKSLQDYRYPMKSHVIMAAMFYGDDVLEVVSKGAKMQINHRNYNHHDNRLKNLEIITGDCNTEHRSRVESYLREKHCDQK